MTPRFAPIAACVLLAVGAGVAIPQETGAGTPGATAPGGVRVEDPRERYVVGFAELSPVDLPPEFRYIASTLPRLIAESFPASMTHRYAEDELAAYAATLLDQAALSARRSLSAAVSRRDALLFERAVTDARRLQAEEAVAAARAMYAALETYGPADTEVPPQKPLRFWDGHNAGRLLSAVALDPELRPDPADLERIAIAADLDLLIWGMIEEIQGYLWVRFFAHSRYRASIPLDVETTALPSEINQEAERLSGAVATVLLGRSWGGLAVATNVPGAAIVVNGSLVGFGSAEARLLAPGRVTLDVTAEGYRAESQELEVRDGETTAVSLSLVPSAERTVRLESAPGGADVYVDSVWVGRTPLTLTVSGEPRVVRLRAPGHLESRFVLSSESPARVARVLLPESVNWAQEIRTARDGFYRSLSWFVLSVPVTIILNGTYQNVLGAYPPAAGPSLAEFGRVGNIFYWSFWGGLLVNIGLFVNMGINLFEYLSVGEGPHNQ